MSEIKDSDYTAAAEKFKDIKESGAINKHIEFVKEMREKNKSLEQNNTELKQKLAEKQTKLDAANVEINRMKSEYNDMFVFYSGIMTNLQNEGILGGEK